MSNGNFINKELQKLTAEIVHLDQLRMTMSNFHDVGCVTREKCRTCLGDDGLKHAHFMGESQRAFICSSCISLSKESQIKKSTVKNPKDICPICLGPDGCLYVPGVSNSLCLRCYDVVNNL